MFPASGFFFPFLLVSVFLPGLQESTHRMKLLSNGSFEKQTLQTRKNKHSQNQAFSFFVICLAAAAETQAHTWGKSFSCFFQGPAYVTQGLLRLGRGGGRRGHKRVSHLADPSCKMSKWWLLIDPEPACGGGDKVVFVVHLAVAWASLSLLQIGGDTASVGSQGGWGGKRPCAWDKGISLIIWLIFRTSLPSFPSSYNHAVYRSGGLLGVWRTRWFIHCCITALMKGSSLSNSVGSLDLIKLA